MLDLAGVTFIDSSGIALLVYISQTAREPLLGARESRRITIDHHTRAPSTDFESTVTGLRPGSDGAP